MCLYFSSPDLLLIDRYSLILIFAGQTGVVVILFLFYKLYKISAASFKARIKGDKKDKVNEISAATKIEDNEGDVNAAIALALYLHMNEMHDEESNVITIQRVSKTYSPWSSKIYSVRNFRR